jgi:hypothetical protein
MIAKRHKKGCYSIAQLLQARNNTGPKAERKVIDPDQKYIICHGYHFDVKPGELFIGRVTYSFWQIINDAPYWKTQRICEECERGDKHALFVERAEVEERGWKIVFE